MLQCFPHASKFVSLKQRKQPCTGFHIGSRWTAHFLYCITLRCWTFKSWQYLFINVYYTGRGIIWRCPSARNCWTALTLPVVIFRSAVDTIVDTVFPLTFAVKVAYKRNSRKHKTSLQMWKWCRQINSYLCTVISKSIHDLSRAVKQRQQLVGSLNWRTGTGVVLLPCNLYRSKAWLLGFGQLALHLKWSNFTT